MGQNKDDIQAQLQALRESYVAQLPGRIAEVEKHWQVLLGPDGSAHLLKELHRQVHSMVGSAGTFGLPELGQQARQVEIRLKALGDNPHVPPNERGAIGEGIAQLRRLMEASVATADQVEPVAAEPIVVPATNLVYLLEENKQHTLRLPETLAHFGYSVKTFHDQAELTAALAAQRPMALIMDFQTSEVQRACTDRLMEYQASQSRELPVLFISHLSEFPARLSAVRAGAYAYLTQPVDVATVMDRLDALSAHTDPEPYRAIVLDDDIELAQHTALVLTGAGIKVRVTGSPAEILALLDEFQPDVILVDLYMPECDGMEVARLIRQDASHVSLPIVFLSSETDPDKQFSALMTGGDEFLTKPIEDRHLISVVKSRAQRSRALESAMSRDSLTGLLKHTKIKEQLELEVVRSHRQGTLLGFAMIDIDLFKKVNDSYGHPVGDRVIKGLSYLLRQRLRSTDLIGRYGGEEFAVILPGADAEGALAVLEDIRQAFAAIEFDADGSKFGVTLSAGVVTCRRCEDAQKLTETADNALYEAKNSGRNRVVSRTL